MGIEPTSEAWEASILPLYDARSFFSFSIIHNCAIASTDRARSFSSSILQQRHRRDLTPDHRTNIASTVDLASQVDLVPAPLAQAGTSPGAVSIIGCARFLGPSLVPSF